VAVVELLLSRRVVVVMVVVFWVSISSGTWTESQLTS
jgi:hypothetical protein